METPNRCIGCLYISLIDAGKCDHSSCFKFQKVRERTRDFATPELSKLCYHHRTARGNSRRVDAEGNGGLKFNKVNQPIDYGGTQPKRTACKTCESVRTKHRHQIDPIEHECTHDACFQLLEFNPYEGKQTRKRIKDYQHSEMNAVGSCPHYKLRMMR